MLSYHRNRKETKTSFFLGHFATSNKTNATTKLTTKMQPQLNFPKRAIEQILIILILFTLANKNGKYSSVHHCK